MWKSLYGAHSLNMQAGEILPEENIKAFLLKMMIVAKDFRDALVSHRPHGNAACQAVMLIEAGFVESKRIEERRMTLWKDGGVRIAENVFDGARRLFSDMGRRNAAKCELFGQHLYTVDEW